MKMKNHDYYDLEKLLNVAQSESLSIQLQERGSAVKHYLNIKGYDYEEVTIEKRGREWRVIIIH